MRRVDAYRAKVGADEVAFALVNLDNTNGKPEFSVEGGIAVVTPRGETIDFSVAIHSVGTWQDLVGPEDSATYNEGVELYKSLLNVDTVLPGAARTVLLIGPKKADSIRFVFLSLGLAGRIELKRT